MTRLLRTIRPTDIALAALLTALGVILMYGNVTGTEDHTTHPWVIIPVFLLVTLPILLRRWNMTVVYTVTILALAAHDLAFGPMVRCGAGLPLAVALAYASGRLTQSRTATLAGLVVSLAVQYFVLVRDTAAGLVVLPWTAAIGVAFWVIGHGVRRLATKRSLASLRDAVHV